VAMANEVLCKILAHNICCLIMSQLELGIAPVFWGNDEEAKKETIPIAAVVVPEPAPVATITALVPVSGTTVTVATPEPARTVVRKVATMADWD
jgi:hypothetical protein